MANVIYTPPPQKLLNKLARRTCVRMAKEHDPSYRSIEFTEGLVDFVNIVAEMKAQQLNHMNTKDKKDGE